MSQCAISASPLEEPIVACKLGYLYNKECLLDRLLHKTMPESFAHIRALKDVKVCKFTREAKEGTLICPVSELCSQLANWGICGRSHIWQIFRSTACTLPQSGFIHEGEETRCRLRTRSGSAS